MFGFSKKKNNISLSKRLKGKYKNSHDIQIHNDLVNCLDEAGYLTDSDKQEMTISFTTAFLHQSLNITQEEFYETINKHFNTNISMDDFKCSGDMSGICYLIYRNIEYNEYEQ